GSWTEDVCPGCWVGAAIAEYGRDAPVQLVEYTFISQVGEGHYDDPNDTRGRPFVGFDVSDVDDAYLPAAVNIDSGVSGYMGSSLGFADHNARINNFLNDPMVQWSAFAAFTDLIFNKSTFYSDLIPSQDDGHGGKKPQTIKLPSGGILMQSSRTDRPGTSQY